MFRESRLIGITCTIVSLPILYLYFNAATNPVDWIDALTSFDFIMLHRFWNTIQIAIFDVLFSTVFSFSVYWVYLHMNGFMKPVIFGCSILPFTFPSFATASSWMILLAQWEQEESTRIIWGAQSEISNWLYSVCGCGFILALHDWPILFFFFVLTSRLSQHQIDACRLYLERRQMLFRVFPPALKMPLLCGGGTIFSFAITHFETASLLQIDVYMLEIYTQFSSLMNIQKALILCLPYVLMSFGFTFILTTVRKHYLFNGGQIRLNGVPYTALCFSIAVYILSIFIPISGFFFQTTFFDVISLAWMQTGRISNSLFYSIGGAGITVLSGLLLANKVKKYQALLISICGILFFLPGILIAAGVLELRTSLPFFLPNWFNRFTLLYAHLCHYALLGFLAGVLLWQQYGKSQMEFERLLQIPVRQKICYLYFPALLLPVMKAIAVIALLIWSDVAVTVLLHPPGGDTLTIYYFNQLHFGSDSRTAATGLLLMAIPLAVVAVCCFATVMMSKWIHTKPLTTIHHSNDE